MTRAGHTRITQAALRHTIEAIAARTFRVPASTVSADLQDESGNIAATLVVPLPAPDLLQPEPAQGNVFDLAGRSRSVLIQQTLELTGRTMGSVDLRLTGAKPRPERKIE